jgi:hypothetical protein
MNLIDFLAIIPFYLALFLSSLEDIQVLNIFELQIIISIKAISLNIFKGFSFITLSHFEIFLFPFLPYITPANLAFVP